jgi:hypothetical protein
MSGALRFCQQGGGTLLHFAGGFPGERDGQNAFRFGAVADEFGNAVRDHARFAGARAGKDQQRSLERADGVELGGIEIRHGNPFPSVSLDGQSG